MSFKDNSPISTFREDALNVRRAVIEMMVEPSSAALFRSFNETGNGVAGCLSGLPDDVVEILKNEMLSISNWNDETWELKDNQEVERVTHETFVQLPPTRRFSSSDCLRKVPESALAIRGLISGLKSEAVHNAVSSALGEKVSFRSADIARYRQGHYLRRHADTYEERRFGLVFFIASGWKSGFGGELVVEGPGGESFVVSPNSGKVAALRIKNGYHHQVAQVVDSTWIRLSIATHFAADDTTTDF